jgi:hypothetical protein
MPAAPGIQAVVWNQKSTVGVSASPFTGQQQVQEWSGQWLEAQVTLPRMTRAQANQWIAFLVSLRGMAGVFMFGDPAGKVPQGAATGAPQISDNANGNGGYSVMTKGWTPNVNHILMPGDWMEIDNHIYMILSDESSDPAGIASFDIWPALRTNPQDGLPIIVNNAQGLFRLSANQTSWDIDEALTFGLQFNCMEAI